MALGGMKYPIKIEQIVREKNLVKLTDRKFVTRKYNHPYKPIFPNLTVSLG